MLFSSIPFLYYFLPVMVAIYFILPRKMKNGALLFGSLFFYAWGERLLVLMLVFTIFLGWLFGIMIENRKAMDRDKEARFILLLSILLDLGLLVYFKYVDFFIGSFNQLFNKQIPLLKVALPIGISFYTFQILSYTVDVYRGNIKANKNIVSFATYVSLFPQLIAGPIVRYADIEEQLSKRQYTMSAISYGVKRFVMGLSKKVLLANTLGELCNAFRSTQDSSVLYYWMYAVSFMLQIYYDFSGYSDMAIGLGRIFGFRFLENFEYPYISKSITEFWRRWHISLGSWFRDYVYIPLGGNRRGIGRQICNIFIVWTLTGLWHGASWNFVLWGLFYGCLLMLEKLFLLKRLDKIPALAHIYTLLMVLLGFVLFNANSLMQVGTDFAGMFGILSIPLLSVEAVYYLKSYLVVFMVAFVGATPLPRKWGKKLEMLESIYVTVLLLLVTAYLIDSSFNPFLYFRF